MKRAILLGLSAAMFAASPAVYAQAEVEAELDQAVVVEQEDGAIANEDLEALLSQAAEFRGERTERRGDRRDDRRSDGEAIVGGIIGGIIGAINADRWDRGHNRPGRYVTCFAENRRGQVFRATARRARAAQDLAMRKCQNNSRSCRPAGCR